MAVTLEERVAQLEEQVRVLTEARPSETVVRASKFVLLDSDGVTRGEWAVHPAGPALVMTGIHEGQIWMGFLSGTNDARLSLQSGVVTHGHILLEAAVNRATARVCTNQVAGGGPGSSVELVAENDGTDPSHVVPSLAEVRVSRGNPVGARLSTTPHKSWLDLLAPGDISKIISNP